MIAIPDATNHLSFKLVKKHITHDANLLLLENEINGMAQMGWQLDKIIPLGKGYFLIVYSGIVDTSPFGGSVEP